jgi:hypothetical protein
MPRVPGRHPRNEPTFSTRIELDIPCRASGLEHRSPGRAGADGRRGSKRHEHPGSGAARWGQARQRVSGKGRGTDAETGARQAGRDHGDRQASKYEAHEEQRRGEGATQDTEEEGCAKDRMDESMSERE